MKKLILVLFIFSVLKVNAQNYLISFTGSGAANTVSTVKVENIRTGETLTLYGNQILSLKGNSGTTGIVDKELLSGIIIYPNPMNDNSIVEFYPPVSGNATISIFDMSGKQVAQIHSYLENSKQEFRLSGVNTGFYLISVKGSTYHYSGKLLCNGNTTGTISIEKTGQSVKKSITFGIIEMLYTLGDKLKFTGISGNYQLTKTDIIDKDKTIEFNFVNCKDASNNNYSTVEIDNHFWMGENLKTTKYNNGTNIPLWTAVDLPGYCWFNNDSATYKATYGALYNWYAIDTAINGNKNVCPVGWHVPAREEWTALSDFLGGDIVAGGKLKETGTTHWTSPNTGATNETGFTALPGSCRTPYGEFVVENIGYNAFFWSSTSYRDFAWIRHLGSFRSDLVEYGYMPQHSLSVRCIKD